MDFCYRGTNRFTSSAASSGVRRSEEYLQEGAAVSKMDMVNEEGVSSSTADCQRRRRTTKVMEPQDDVPASCGHIA